jgi:hypothetical protein
VNAEDNGNDKAAGSQRNKKPGGVTGKGFKPGQSGNPTGINTRKETKAFGEFLRSWLEKHIKVKDEKGNTHKVRRLDDILRRVTEQKPEVLLHYAYGKPAEMVDLSTSEGGKVDFVVKLVTNGNGSLELP